VKYSSGSNRLKNSSKNIGEMFTTQTVESDVHVTVRRVKFLIIKPTRCTNFSNLFLV